jgi:hypothetical protein
MKLTLKPMDFVVTLLVVVAGVMIAAPIKKKLFKE